MLPSSYNEMAVGKRTASRKLTDKHIFWSE